MNYQSANFGGDGNWNENVKKGLKVEVSLKIYMIFLSFVNIYVLRKIKKLKLYMLPPRRAAEVVECVRKYVDGSSQNLQSLSSY